MPLNFTVRLVPLSLLAALVIALPAHAKDSLPPPAPGTLHAQLTQISEQPAQLAEALRRGEKSAGVCRHCHGPGGNSVIKDVPNLASQNASYLLEQMNKFVSGQRKSSDFMMGMIKALTPEERIDVALFLSRQPVTAKPAVTTPQAAAGKRMYDKLCVSCHGATGTGTQKIPRLAGQQPDYLEGSLKRYRAGTGERIDPMMAAYTRNLKDPEIANLAAYLTSMRP